MDSNQPSPPPSRGLGLRTQLVLGFAVLLAILFAVGVESISLLDRLGGSIDVILRENYASVVACERMKESLERMDSGALFALAGEGEQGRTLVARNHPRFEAALKAELGNITLPGEGARAARLRKLYAGYAPVLQRILSPQVPPEERRTLYFRDLYPTFLEIKETADAILQLNQQNMVEANDRARRLARSATRRMAFLLLAGTALAGLCVFLLSRAILGPLERLTRAAGEIERGNLDLNLPVTSRDELGQLAAAFNSMAAGLRELRQSDQALLLRARRVAQSVLDDLPQAVAVVAPERTVELTNRAASTLLGLRPGKPIPERHGAWLSPLLDRIESGHGARREVEETVRIEVEGCSRDLLPRASALREQGSPGGVVLVVEDVTPGALRRALSSSLLANAAHDVERAAKALSADSNPVALDRLGRLGAIADHLLAMSRLEELRQQLRPEPVAPGDLVAAAVREAAASYGDEQVALETKLDPAAPPVLADRERIGQVLGALLRNARAHSTAGGSVTVKAEPEEGRVRFTVADAGGGIPAAELEKVFASFYQIPGTEDLGDAGLGLSLARDVVLAHGGEIRVESEEGRGAAFRFTLPAAAPAPPAAAARA